MCRFRRSRERLRLLFGDAADLRLVPGAARGVAVIRPTDDAGEVHIGSGNGQTDLELRSSTDVVWGTRFWNSFTLRLAAFLIVAVLISSLNEKERRAPRARVEASEACVLRSIADFSSRV